MPEAASSISIGSDGLKISYVRFLSDISGGFMLLLIAFVVLYLRIPLLGWTFTPTADLPDTIIVFFCSLCLLLAPALGMALNGIGYMTLSWPLDKIEQAMLFRQFWCPESKKRHNFEACQQALGITNQNWQQIAGEKHTELVKRDPAKLANLDPVKGAVILFRSICLCALGIAFLTGITFEPEVAINLTRLVVFLLIAMAGFFACAFMRLYHDTLVLQMASIPKTVENKRRKPTASRYSPSPFCTDHRSK